MNYQGFYINLDSSLERRKSIEKHLKKINLSSNYQRFRAYSPKPNQDLFGLRTSGEYGIWLSMLSLLEKLSVEKDKGFVHIIEDDFRFNTKTILRLKEIISLQEKNDQDILFLDYMISLPLLNLINLHIRNKNEFGDKREIFYPARNYYFSCMSSFLLRRSSIKLLFEILNKVFLNLKLEKKLIPIDMVLKRLLRSEVFKGSIIVPPLGSPDWDLDNKSTIQSFTSQKLKDSKRVYTLIRCAASGTKSPDFCALEFAKIVKQNIDKLKITNLEDFYKFVENNKDKIRHDW
tara:strand:+ start:211 stop:1080 length:870 start_codon:yes stop_codon:yes gene_type:complete